MQKISPWIIKNFSLWETLIFLVVVDFGLMFAVAMAVEITYFPGPEIVVVAV